VLRSAGTPFAAPTAFSPDFWRVLSRPIIDGVAGPSSEHSWPHAIRRADLEKTFSPVGVTSIRPARWSSMSSRPVGLKGTCNAPPLDMIDASSRFDAAGALLATITTASSMWAASFQAGRMSV